MTNWEEYLKEHQPRFVEELVEFLHIPSVATLPEHADDMKKAAAWVAMRLEKAGVEGVRVMPTPLHPVVYGEWLHAPGKPTILIYGHYDVQPVDPIGLWTNPPFDPFVKEGRVYARGAADMKGNMLLIIAAVEALLKTNKSLPVNVKFLFEGQEEMGSPYLPEFVEENKQLFSCDLALSGDGGQFGETQPSLTVAARGICKLEMEVICGDRDLHSGSYGGTVHNPLHVLAHMVDSMHKPDGSVAVEGFYDDVLPLSPADREMIAAVPYDEASFKQEIGVDALFGEPGFTPRERTWARPTLEVNGLWGGYQGEGTKTVIPKEAHAKITCRLVADQDPFRIQDLVRHHIEAHTPEGVKVKVQQAGGVAVPFLVSADHPGVLAVGEVLTELYGKKPIYIRTGGTVAILELILRYLGVYTVTMAFAMNDERVHSPNEFFRLASFERGQLAYGKLLEKLGRVK